MEEVKRCYIQAGVSPSSNLCQVLNMQDYSSINLLEQNNRDNQITDRPSFAFVGELISGLQLIKNNKQSVTSSLPLISLNHVDDRQFFIANGGRAIIDPSLIEFPAGEKMVSRLNSSESASLSLPSALADSLAEYRSIKITSVLGVGYYADIVAYDCYQAGFNPVAIRAFITHITTYYAYLVQAAMARFPLDVEYGWSEREFVIQFNTPVQQFVSEYLFESFAHYPSATSPFKSLLGQSMGVTDLLDICYLKKSEKLIIGGLWQKSSEQKMQQRFPSLILCEVESFKQRTKEVKQMLANPQLALSRLQEQMNEVAKTAVLPGALEPLKEEESLFLKNPLLLGRFARYASQIRSLEEQPISVEKLVPEDIDGLLAEYPNPDMVEKLTYADKLAIIKALVDPASLKEVEARIAGVTQHFIEENQMVKGSPEEQDMFKQVIKSLDDLDQADLNEWVRGSLLKEDENTLVKGRFDEDDSKTIIKGSAEIIKDEVWKVKGESVKKELKDAVMRVKNLGGSASDLKNEMAKVLSQGLQLNDEPSNVAGENLLAQAMGRLAIEKEKLASNEEFSADLRVKKLLEELDHKNGLLEKYRKMISALKVENDSAKSVEQTIQSMDLSGQEVGGAVDKIVSELKSAERNIKSRDQVIENLKQKLKRFEAQEMRVNQVQEQKQDDDSKQQAKLLQDYQKIKSQHQSTQVLLEVSNKKIAVLTQELHEANQHAKGHDSVGMARLKDSLKNAQTRLVTLLKEKTELQALLKKMQVESQQVQNLKESNERQKAQGDKRDEFRQQELEKLLERLKQDLNGVNEKHRDSLTTISEQNRQIKALELQLKNATSLEKKNEAKFATVASDEDKNAFKVKQLETVNERLEVASKKALADLNEKKKELMQMKSENTMLKNKIQALERKVVKR